MRCSLLFIFVLTIPLSVYSQERTAHKSDSLHNVTIIRPADFFLNKPGWNFSSIDMYTYNINNGIYGNYGPQPEVLIDGIPVDINFFGWQNLNMLPLYLPNISKVESNTDPGLYKEDIYHAGVINFINQMPPNGLNLKGMVYLGNESGDPGPWVYDSTQVTPNVDRWGPDAGGIFSIRENKWYERIIFIQRKHQQTDPITHRRIHSTVRNLGGTQFYPVQTITQSGLFETGYNSKSLNFKTRIILADDQNYLYLQPFAREVPSKAEYQQIVLSGGYKADKWKLGLSYAFNQKKLKRRNSDHNYIFNWNQDNSLFNGYAAFTFNNFSLKGSFNFNQQMTDAPGIFKNKDFLTDITVVTKWQKSRLTTYGLSADLNIHKNQTARTIKASYSQILSSLWNIKLTGIFNEVLPISQQSFGYWISRGYNFYNELGINIEEPLVISKNRLVNLKLEALYKPTAQLTFSTTSELTHFDEINIPWQDANYDVNTGTSPGLFIISQEKGTRFALHAITKHQPFEWFNQELSMDFGFTLLGTNRFKEYFQQLPDVQVKYQVHLAATENLIFSLEGYYRSSTKWKEFDALDGQEYRDIDNLFPVLTGTYSNSAPSYFNIEIGAKKWFSNETFSIQFTLRNLLNDVIQLHPFGAEQSFMFNIKATAIL